MIDSMTLASTSSPTLGRSTLESLVFDGNVKWGAKVKKNLRKTGDSTSKNGKAHMNYRRATINPNSAWVTDDPLAPCPALESLRVTLAVVAPTDDTGTSIPYFRRIKSFSTAEMSSQVRT
ncbi:hypothetical protein V7S43_008633 [Phytophthora oleae]|uniref:Uncharacterized protein n=1 Tax=Phytophthora oleae TaxID=2107226 RepID=A0ABD3FKJ3_9STRA